MTDLTEKWKNGELKDGWYYVETNEPFKPSKVIILEYYRTSFESDIDSNYIYKIIAPVPSYEEWKSVCDDCNSMQETIFSQDSIYCENENLLEEIEKIDGENTKLKNVISEMCKELVDLNDDMSNGLSEWFSLDLLLKISEILK